MGFINLTKFNQVGPADLGGTNAALTSTYLRVAGTFDMAGWDTGVGVQSWSGSAAALSFTETADPLSTPIPNVVTVTPVMTLIDTKATAIDFQMQGEVGKMPLGFYVTYAKAPVVAAVAGGTAGNAFKGGAFTKSSFNLAGELGVNPEKATVGLAIRRGKSGVDDGLGANASDNAFLIEGSYKLAQNMMLNLVYTRQSGSYWDLINPDTAVNPSLVTNSKLIGSRQTILNLAILF